MLDLPPSLRMPLSHHQDYHTLPETNSLPMKIGHPKRKLVFQPSIFRCENVSFREGILVEHSLQIFHLPLFLGGGGLRSKLYVVPTVPTLEEPLDESVVSAGRSPKRWQRWPNETSNIRPWPKRVPPLACFNKGGVEVSGGTIPNMRWCFFGIFAGFSAEN